VDACPTLALKFVEESEAKDFIAKAEYLKPERAAKDGVRVHYQNLPKRFIAGTVYDPVEKEVVIGASVTLAAKGGKKTYSAKTDGFGDFEFEKLPVGQFTFDDQGRQRSPKRSRSAPIRTLAWEIFL